MEKDKTASWLTVTKLNKTQYQWTAQANTGRLSRSTSIEVCNVTPPTGSASTLFNQGGADNILSIISENPRDITGYSTGEFIITCNTNLASVDVTYIGEERTSIDMVFAGASTLGGLSVSYLSPGIQRLTFTGDPGTDGQFQFYVTYSYQSNPSVGKRYGEIFFNSQSVSSVTQSVTQSAGSSPT